MAAGSPEVIQGLAAILQQAAAALATLGAQPGGDASSAASLTASVAALGQLLPAVSQLAAHAPGSGADGAGACQGARSGGLAIAMPTDPGSQPSDDPLGLYRGDEEESSEFCAKHGLEPWVGEALDLLTAQQRSAVMGPAMNTVNTRNLNGIVVSRIKQVVPLEQRLGLFVTLNDLGEGVVDRISTLTEDQAEAVMESGIKIQKANNPSGVAMRRITDALKSDRAGGDRGGRWRQESRVPIGSGDHRGRHDDSRSGRGSGPRHRSRTPRRYPEARGSESSLPGDLQDFVTSTNLEWWCAEVLKRLSLYQRRQICKDMMNMGGVRNPSGVVMSRVRSTVDVGELTTIFIDLNQIDDRIQAQLHSLSPEQQSAVIAPGIYLQNVRNPSVAVRSRIQNVLAGNDAFGKPLREQYAE